jgi:tetratricopeptide (TPR) repeat protein
MKRVQLSVEGIMDLSKTFRRLGLAAMFAVIVTVVPAFAQTGGLTGKATLQDGSICANCPIIIERVDVKGSFKTKTNKKGEYTYIGLPLGEYKITLEDPSGKVLFYIQDRVGMGDPTQADFDLPRLVAAVRKEQAANPEFQQKMQEEEKAKKQIAGLQSLYDQGNGLYSAQKYSEAAEKFEQALPLAKGKNRLAVLARLADTYAKANQKDKAITIYQEAIEADPTSAGLHNNLGSLYADKGDIDKAKEQFQKAAELDPNGAAQYYFNLGAIMYNTGKMDDAVTALKKAIDLDPKLAIAYFWLGQSLLGKATTGEGGKVVAAPGTKEAFETYLQLDPNGANAATAKALLQTIEGGVETEFTKKKKR